ncbi:glycosyltransferase [Alcaligenes faecalis]|uniref:glycosyltransferase n=1 Tax=Alcaligenes faecalis TaxID=511 RepID=UPI001292EDF6|nr:glycosyltransferase [Alcaligenes faecalis]QFY79347.1 glycosyltransferase [Alcaligenes faecalis]
MHVLLTVFFNSPIGGLQENIYSTAVYLKAKNNEVTVACKEGVFADRLRAIGVAVVVTDYALFSYYSVLEKIKEINSRKKINLVHCHPFSSRRLGVIVSRVLGVPCVVTMHGKYTDEIRKNISFFDAVFTVSEGIRRYLVKEAEIPEEHIHVVPNAVDVSVFDCDSSRKYQSEDLVFSLVTRLDSDKKFILDIFYKIVSYVSKKYSKKIIWNIVGDGKLKAEFLETVKILAKGNSVVYKGWLEGRNLSEEYSRSSVVIGPGRCALEAMSCGTPTIALGSASYSGLVGPDTWQKAVYSNFGGVGVEQEDDIDKRIEADLDILMSGSACRRKLGLFSKKIIESFFRDDMVQERLYRFYEINSCEIKEKKKEEESDFMELKLRPLTVHRVNGGVRIRHNIDDDELRYGWVVERNGDALIKVPYGSNKELSFNCDEQGEYKVRCSVRNSLGKSVVFVGLEFVV